MSQGRFPAPDGLPQPLALAADDGITTEPRARTAECPSAGSAAASLPAGTAVAVLFRALADLVPVLLWQTDPTGEVVTLNDRWREYTGQAPPETQHRGWLLAIHPDDRPHTGRVFREAFLTQRPAELEHRIRRHDGAYRWFLVRHVPLRDDAGRVVAWFGAATDVHDQRAARDELEKRVEARTAELRASQERVLRGERLAAIGEMIAGLAHESRNALQRGQACLSMLSFRLQGQPDALDLVDRVQAAQNDLHRLYEDVRAYAAPLRFDPVVCNLAGVWREAWGELDVARAGRAAELVEQLECSDALCMGSPFYLKQVFRNLLDNALGAVDGPVRIGIRCGDARLGGRPALRLAVHDNGPGFTAEQRQKAFEPFFTTKTHGTGLGLAICERIVEAHGGTMEIAGQEERGGCIILYLPRAQP